MRRWYGNLVIAAHLRGQKRFPFLPAAQVARLRDRRLRRLVRYAARNVPYYRELFSREDLDPREIRSVDDLRLLPMLDPDVVRTDPEAFLATGRRARRALRLRTSGTTGAPVEVYHDPRSVLANIAWGERERRPVIDLCGGGFRPRELHIGYETSNFRQILDFYRDNARLPVRPRRVHVSMASPLEDIIARINEYRPHIVTAYGTFVDMFFRAILAREVDVHLPKVVMYVGETLPTDRRAFIESHFGVAVMSRYCSVEAFKIGYFCQARTAFHLHEDLCHVRIARADGSDAAPGEQGQIVISNLVNYATVLLNYPTGDVAAISPAPCGCGRSSRMLSELEGRVEDALILRDGNILHPRAVWSVFKERTQVLQYQLIQHELDRFELKLVMVDATDFEPLREPLIADLQALLGRDAVIDLEQRAELGRAERERTGKFRAVECRYRPA